MQICPAFHETSQYSIYFMLSINNILYHLVPPGEEERLLASPESPSRTPAPNQSYGAINS